MVIAKDELVKEDILYHAQQLFQQFGLKKTTMDEIAEACGKAKSTLYHYFRGKEEVFDEVIQMELTNLRVLVKNHVEEKKYVRDKIIIYFIKFHEEVLSMINIYRIVKHELMNNDLVRVYFHRLMEFEKSYITRILEDGYDSGEFTEIDKQSIPWFSEVLLAAFFGIVRYSIETEAEFDQRKLEFAAEVLLSKIFI
jgi:AcrR family transcriptional regulator